jgi:hypothetical protein
MKSKIEFMDKVIPARDVAKHMFKVMSSYSEGRIAPLQIDLAQEIHDPREDYTPRTVIENIVRYFEFICEINTAEYAVAIQTAKIAEEFELETGLKAVDES